MEFCQYSVQDFFGNQVALPQLETIRKQLGATEILRQSTEGLVYLHGLGYLHRNLHPSNFRIASYSDGSIHQIKISDFRISKTFVKQLENTNPHVKDGWIAPESKTLKIYLENSLDVFVLGTYYCYVLFGGRHPFERTKMNEKTPDYLMMDIRNEYHSIYKDFSGTFKRNYDAKIWREGDMELQTDNAIALIQEMIKFQPQDRILSNNILKHPFFQPGNTFYDIYDNGKIPGLALILSQEKFENKVTYTENSITLLFVKRL